MSHETVSVSMPAFDGEKRLSEIEHKHNARCLWQQMVGDRRIMAECLFFPRIGEHGSTAISIKQYDKPIPRSGSGKPWPKLIGHQLYMPIGDDNTWNGMDAELDRLSRPAEPQEAANG